MFLLKLIKCPGRSKLSGGPAANVMFFPPIEVSALSPCVGKKGSVPKWVILNLWSSLQFGHLNILAGPRRIEVKEAPGITRN